jgi:diguanylate cyclase (GGDEF)-like protein
MREEPIVAPGFEADELRGFSRTIAEIEWLLVILVLLYQVVRVEPTANSGHIILGLLLYSVFVIGFRYFNIYRSETRWKLAIETWVMIVIITWVLYNDTRLASPLVNLYLLTVITSALTLGKMVTLLEVLLIAACYVFLGYSSDTSAEFTIQSASELMAQLAPIMLVAYITTMLSADIRLALSRIKLISETDELTGIYNVRAFTALADRTHKQAVRYGQIYSIIMIDSDNLKVINDTHGHEAGNRLLKLTVTNAQKELRQTDVLARYGGDEFVVLLPQTPINGALEVAERIRRAIEATPLDVRGVKAKTTVSCGVASYPAHGDELAAIMNRADQSLYASKKDGRNRVTGQ